MGQLWLRNSEEKGVLRDGAPRAQWAACGEAEGRWQEWGSEVWHCPRAFHCWHWPRGRTAPWCGEAMGMRLGHWLGQIDRAWGTSAGGREGALRGCPGPQEMPLIFYPCVILPKHQTAGLTFSLSPGGRAPLRAALPPSGSGRTTQRAAAWPETQSPRGERKRLGLTLFIFSMELSQCWARSCCPQNIHHIEL